VAGRSPRIGIAGAKRIERERATFQAYVEAIENAGGEAVPVLPGADPQAALADLDGLVLTGGLDVDPAAYGETVLPDAAVELDPDRDALELPLARAAVQRDLPVFAICRGIQVLNVALGGTLYQDVDVQRAGSQRWSHQQRKSRPDAPLHAAIHQVTIRPGSRLHEIVGGHTLGVNTFHHQAVKEVAPGLVATAWEAAPAGAAERPASGGEPALVEAVEAPQRRFVLGVQWHPERMWKQDAACARLFHAIVDAADASHATGPRGARRRRG